MNYIITTILFLLSMNKVFSQTTMQATIKQGPGLMVVNVYLKPSASFSQKDEVMNLAIALPAGITPAPSGESGNTPNGTGQVPNISGMIPNFLVNNLGSLLRSVVVTTEPVNGVPHYVYSFVFNSTGTSEHAWAAGEEQLIFSISFDGCTSNCSVIGMKLVNLPNGGARNQANWYFQANTIGDITNYPAPFYANEKTLPLFGGESNDGSALAYLELADILPVKMHSMNIAANDCKVKLSWQVSHEANFAYYAVERGVNTVNFNEVGRMNASNSSEANKSYGFIDDRSPSGNIFYRIRQVDKDGSFTYSSIMEVTLNCRGKNNVLVYPTVTKGIVNVKLPPGFEGAKIRVINGDGKDVLIDKSPGFSHTINLLQMTNGTYTLQVINDNKITDNIQIIIIH